MTEKAFARVSRYRSINWFVDVGCIGGRKDFDVARKLKAFEVACQYGD